MYSFTFLTDSASTNSIRATGMPPPKMPTTASTAFFTDGKTARAAVIASGMPYTFSVSSVMTPSVPSEPTNMPFRWIPEEDLAARLPVWMMSPFASTTSRSLTWSRMMPYRTEVVPLAFVAAIPPSVASAPGSTVKNKPYFFSSLFRTDLVTPGWTVTRKSLSFTSMIEFICDRSSEIPPLTGITCPSRLVPKPNGTTGIFRSFANFSTLLTSTLFRGKTTTSGRQGS